MVVVVVSDDVWDGNCCPRTFKQSRGQSRIGAHRLTIDAPDATYRPSLDRRNLPYQMNGSFVNVTMMCRSINSEADLNRRCICSSKVIYCTRTFHPDTWISMRLRDQFTLL